MTFVVTAEKPLQFKNKPITHALPGKGSVVRLYNDGSFELKYALGDSKVTLGPNPERVLPGQEVYITLTAAQLALPALYIAGATKQGTTKAILEIGNMENDLPGYIPNVYPVPTSGLLTIALSSANGHTAPRTYAILPTLFEDASNGDAVGDFSATDSLGAPVSGVTFSRDAGSSKFQFSSNTLQYNTGALDNMKPEVIRIKASKTGLTDSFAWFTVWVIPKQARVSLSSKIVTVTWNDGTQVTTDTVYEGNADCFLVANTSGGSNFNAAAGTYQYFHEVVTALAGVNDEVQVRLPDLELISNHNSSTAAALWNIRANVGRPGDKKISFICPTGKFEVVSNAGGIGGGMIGIDMAHTAHTQPPDVVFKNVNHGLTDRMRPCVQMEEEFTVDTGTGILIVGTSPEIYGEIAHLQPVLLSATNGLPTPWTDTDVYWAIRISRNVIKLASSRANAIAGTAIPLTSGVPANSQTIIGTIATFSANPDTDEITFENAQFANYPKYSLIVIQNLGGALPSGLTAGTMADWGNSTQQYVVVPTGPTTAKLADSYVNARDGVYVALGSAGTGHHFSRMVTRYGGWGFTYDRCPRVVFDQCRFSQHAGDGLSTSQKNEHGNRALGSVTTVFCEFANSGYNAGNDHNIYIHEASMNMIGCISHSSLGFAVKWNGENLFTWSTALGGHFEGASWTEGRFLGALDHTKTRGHHKGLRVEQSSLEGVNGVITNYLRQQDGPGLSRCFPPYWKLLQSDGVTEYTEDDPDNERISNNGNTGRCPLFKYGTDAIGLVKMLPSTCTANVAGLTGGVLSIESISLLVWNLVNFVSFFGSGAIDLGAMRDDHTWYYGSCAILNDGGDDCTLDLNSFSPAITGSFSAGNPVFLKRDNKNWELPALNKLYHGSEAPWLAISTGGKVDPTKSYSTDLTRARPIPQIFEDVFNTPLAARNVGGYNLYSCNIDIATDMIGGDGSVNKFMGLPLPPQKDLSGLGEFAYPAGAGEFRCDLSSAHSSPAIGTNGSGGSGVGGTWAVQKNFAYFDGVTTHDQALPIGKRMAAQIDLVDVSVSGGVLRNAHGTQAAVFWNKTDGTLGAIDSTLAAGSTANPLPTPKQGYAAAGSRGDLTLRVDSMTAAPEVNDRAHVACAGIHPRYFFPFTVSAVSSLGGGSYTLTLNGERLPGDVTAGAKFASAAYSPTRPTWVSDQDPSVYLPVSVRIQ